MPTQNQSRFNELLKEFHRAQDEARIYAERIRSSRLASGIPLLEHYSEGRATWVFDMNAPLKRADINGRGVSSGSGESLMDFSILLHANIANRGILNNWNEKPMLVSHIHNMHGPNGEIPSVVGLYLARKKIEKSRRGSVYFQIPKGNFKLLAHGINGEFSSLPVATGDQSLNGFQPNIIESALEIVDGISDDQWQAVEGLSILSACKVALDVFQSTVRVYMARNSQSFFQAINAPLKISDVMVGPFDLETCTFADRHAESSLPYAI